MFNKNREQIIKFGLDEVLSDINIPLPSKKYLPDWFKSSPRYFDKGQHSIVTQGKTFKVCMPFTDALISGYIFELWTDVDVVKNDEIHTLYIKDDRYKVFATRDSRSTGDMPTPEGFSNLHYVLRHPLFIQTPPGYSILVTQPFNRFDLPFMAMTGIVDSDKEPFFPGNYSLFLKENYEGVIEAGTPILQIIPFKRDSWKSIEDVSIVEKGWLASNKSVRKILGWYRDNAWAKKEYM